MDHHTGKNSLAWTVGGAKKCPWIADKESRSDCMDNGRSLKWPCNPFKCRFVHTMDVSDLTMKYFKKALLISWTWVDSTAHTTEIRVDMDIGKKHWLQSLHAPSRCFWNYGITDFILQCACPPPRIHLNALMKYHWELGASRVFMDKKEDYPLHTNDFNWPIRSELAKANWLIKTHDLGAMVEPRVVSKGF